MNHVHIEPNSIVYIRPGDHFQLLLPDDTLLDLEQTQDDFSIVRSNGIVAYTKATSTAAILEDEYNRKNGINPSSREQTTGFN